MRHLLGGVFLVWLATAAGATGAMAAPATPSAPNPASPPAPVENASPLLPPVLTPSVASPPAETPSVKLGVAFQFYTVDYVGSSTIAGAFPLGWNRFLFLPTAQLSPELGFKGRFAIDNFGVSSQGLGAGHLRSSGLDIGSPFYVDWGYVSFTPPDGTYHFGMLNFNRELRIGRVLENPFDAPAVYPIALSRYGGVGTPPLTQANTLDSATNRTGPWLVGTNIASELLDPNSTFANFPAPALSLIMRRELADTRLTVATMNGTPGASIARAHDPAQARGLYLPLNFPETAPLYQGYSLLLAERNVGPLRIEAGFRADHATMGSGQGKYSSVTVEGELAQVRGALSLGGQGLPIDRLGAYAYRDDLAGFGLGLGLKAHALGPLRPGAFSFISYGPLVRTPAWGWAPRVTLAMQQTNGPAGEALAAGYTIETSFRLHPALPMMHAEYSLGKFTPDRPNELLNPFQPITHQVYSFLTTFAF